ncbi:hypothetical protein GW7_15967 [Heterocephalus glaber]|uniref:Uncharacterized protein n=1 Tax=Heterocephalus glaber TaxID=10181 RepID=G5BJC7_HETGA|nr:hypothetical protein GW7_15967 [Heterocephalus glaber]
MPKNQRAEEKEHLLSAKDQRQWQDGEEKDESEENLSKEFEKTNSSVISLLFKKASGSNKTNDIHLLPQDE